MSDEIAVEPTRDVGFLRRWMLRPAFVKRMGFDPKSPLLDGHFLAIYISGAKFFSVIVRGIERGCIIFGLKPDAWELHLCLATKFADTRIAVRKTLAAVGGKVVARYEAGRRSLNLLLDDLGFTEGTTLGAYRVREFNPQPSS